MYYGYDPSDDPRFKEDERIARDIKDDEDARNAEDLRSRDEDLKLDREEELRNEQLREAFSIVRENLSYNDFVSLQADLRSGKVTNNELLDMAKDFAKSKR